MTERGMNQRTVKFDNSVWEDALKNLAHLNHPDYYFDFEDRLIEEIVISMIKLPPVSAKEEILRIKEIVEKDIKLDRHVLPFLRSMRTSIRGAASTALSNIS